MKDSVRADPSVRPSGASRLIHTLRRLQRRPTTPLSAVSPRFDGGAQAASAPTPSGGALRRPRSTRDAQGAPTLDCQRPDAPADLPITHGLQLAAIEGRLAKLESQMTNQNRLLLIGILALIGDLAKQILKP